MGSWTFLVLVFGSVVGVQSQRYFNNYDVKPGACPPALPVRICSQSCTTDSQCFRNEKCCPTNCGGAICTTPVTMRNPAQRRVIIRHRLPKDFPFWRKKNVRRPIDYPKEYPRWNNEMELTPPPQTLERDYYSARANAYNEGYRNPANGYNEGYRNPAYRYNDPQARPVADPYRENPYDIYGNNQVDEYGTRNPYNYPPPPDDGYPTYQNRLDPYRNRQIPYPPAPVPPPNRNPYNYNNMMNHMMSNMMTNLAMQSQQIPPNMIPPYRTKQQLEEEARQNQQPVTPCSHVNIDTVNLKSDAEPAKHISIDTSRRKLDELMSIDTYPAARYPEVVTPTVVNIAQLQLNINQTKPGSCPSQSVGKWVCSSTCTIDSDCSGSRKCCKNRCGAMVCEKVDVEDFPSVELPPATMKPIYELPPMNYPTTTERSVMYSHNPFLSNMNRNYNRYNK